jgi:hypothetical protein
VRGEASAGCSSRSRLHRYMWQWHSAAVHLMSCLERGLFDVSAATHLQKPHARPQSVCTVERCHVMQGVWRLKGSRDDGRGDPGVLGAPQRQHALCCHPTVEMCHPLQHEGAERTPRGQEYGRFPQRGQTLQHGGAQGSPQRVSRCRCQPHLRWSQLRSRSAA